jgi:hypothetical protein
MSHNSTYSYPAYSMGTKGKADAHKTRESLQKPGPGAYEYRENSKKIVFNKEPSYGIGTGGRTDFTNSTENLMKPSPNKYLPNFTLTSNRRRDPKYGFGTSTRSAMSTLEANPSPNKYTIPS